MNSYKRIFTYGFSLITVLFVLFKKVELVGSGGFSSRCWIYFISFF